MGGMGDEDLDLRFGLTDFDFRWLGRWLGGWLGGWLGRNSINERGGKGIGLLHLFGIYAVVFHEDFYFQLREYI